MSFSWTSGCEASSPRSDGSSANRILVAGSTAMPARAASSGACCPNASGFTLSPHPNAKSAKVRASSGESRCAPMRRNSATVSS